MIALVMITTLMSVHDDDDDYDDDDDDDDDDEDECSWSPLLPLSDKL